MQPEGGTYVATPSEATYCRDCWQQIFDRRAWRRAAVVRAGTTYTFVDWYHDACPPDGTAPLDPERPRMVERG